MSDPYRENSTVLLRDPKIGDVVVLKSGGGPKMTWGYTDGQSAEVVYFDEENKLHKLYIRTAALKLAE